MRESDPPNRTDDEAAVVIDLARRRAVAGSAILDAPETVESVWGEGHSSMWSRGEAFILCGPDGVGKTTIAQQLTLHLSGALVGPFLGLPVQPAGRVLYLACDRPTQALRSFRRMVGEADREILDRNLTIWRGPLPFDLARRPTGLVELAQYFDAHTVLIDSLKDVASDLSKEEAGLGLGAAFQTTVADGIEVAALHHQRKQQAGASKPRHLSDVYGSRWITAGAGSVAMLWGEPGDLIVDLDHLKQPSETVGPLKVIHDHVFGVSTLAETVDALSMVRRAHNGITAAAVAAQMFDATAPSRNQIERARRQLERLARDHQISKRDGHKGGKAGENAALYFAGEDAA